MKLSHICSAILVLLGSTTAAVAEDKPHRPWGKSVEIDMTLIEAQTCIARAMDRIGSVLILPTENGAQVDWTVSSASIFNQSMGEPNLTFVLTEGEALLLTILYRHPLSSKSVDGTVRDLEKRCLKTAGPPTTLSE